MGIAQALTWAAYMGLGEAVTTQLGTEADKVESLVDAADAGRCPVFSPECSRCLHRCGFVNSADWHADASAHTHGARLGQQCLVSVTRFVKMVQTATTRGLEYSNHAASGSNTEWVVTRALLVVL